MNDTYAKVSAHTGVTERGVTAVGALASLTALFSAAACCVLPLAFAAVGIGAGGLAAFVPYRWPFTIGAAVAVAVGWALYFQKRRACTTEVGCTATPSSRGTALILSFATLMIALSALWGFIEQPLMRALGGA